MGGLRVFWHEFGRMWRSVRVVEVVGGVRRLWEDWGVLEDFEGWWRVDGNRWVAEVLA